MNTDTRPLQQLLERQRGSTHHSKLIVCGAGAWTVASGGEAVHAFEIDLECVSSLFPSEDDEPTAGMASRGQPGIADSHRQVTARSLTEGSILTIVPAGPRIVYAERVPHHRSRASRQWRLPLAAFARSTTRTLQALRCAGLHALSMARTIATRTCSLTYAIAVAGAAAIAATVMQIAKALRSAEPVAIAAGHRSRSAVASLAATAVSAVRQNTRLAMQSAHAVTRPAARHGRDAATRVRLALMCVRTYAPHVRHRAGRLLNDTRRTLTTLTGSVLSRRQVSLVASVIPILVVIAVLGIRMFEAPPAQLLAASPWVDRATMTSLRAPLQPLTPAGEPQRRPTTALAPAPKTPTNQASASAPVAATAAIQRVLNRYRDAFSTLDDRGVQSVWPSVDVRSLRTDFDRLYEQNLDYDACDITAGPADARAVCRGIVQSMPTSTRINRRESRRWRFVLRKADDRWLIDAVDVSSGGGDGGAIGGR